MVRYDRHPGPRDTSSYEPTFDHSSDAYARRDYYTNQGHQKKRDNPGRYNHHEEYYDDNYYNKDHSYMDDRSKEDSYQPPRKGYRPEYNDDNIYNRPYDEYMDFDEEEYHPDSYRGSRSSNQPSYDQGYDSNLPKYPYTDHDDYEPNFRYNQPDSDHSSNHDDHYDSDTRSSRGLQPPWKPYTESSYERDAKRYDYEEEEFRKPVYKDKKRYSYYDYKDKHENTNSGYGRGSSEYSSQKHEKPYNDEGNNNYGSSSKTYSRSSAHYRDKHYSQPYRHEHYNDISYIQPEKENHDSHSHNRHGGQYGSYEDESDYDNRPYADRDDFSNKPYDGEDTYSAMPYAGEDTYSAKRYAGKDAYSGKLYAGEDRYKWKPERYNRKVGVRHHGSRGLGAMDGGYSSFQPSYNPTKGEPTTPYDPSAWARWEAGETGPPSRSRRRGAKRRVPTGGNWDTEEWRGASGPSGAGDTTTTVTKSHIIHHYKPEGDEEEKRSSGDTSVIGAIKKHLPPLPPLPKLPWPFGARRMGVETGDEIYIDGVKEDREYPDSIQSILENLDDEGTSLAPQQSLPFLDEDDMYFTRNDGYEYHNNL